MNYIRVDEDDLDKVIRVYDDEDKVYREFDEGSRLQHRAQAMEYAKQEATRLGIKYGANWC
jgi:hypothetical protein